jgi:hypothetical protein
MSLFSRRLNCGVILNMKIEWNLRQNYGATLCSHSPFYLEISLKNMMSQQPQGRARSRFSKLPVIQR